MNIEWFNKKIPNSFGLIGAILVCILWQFLPIPSYGYVLFGINWVGSSLCIIFSIGSLILVITRKQVKILRRICLMTTISLLISLLLLVIQVFTNYPLIFIINKDTMVTNLNIPLMIVLVLAFMIISVESGFKETFTESYSIIGIPLFLTDVFFAITIPLLFDGSSVLGAGGLRDGLNMMFFATLLFIVVSQYAKKRLSISYS